MRHDSSNFCPRFFFDSNRSSDPLSPIDGPVTDFSSPAISFKKTGGATGGTPMAAMDLKSQLASVKLK